MRIARRLSTHGMIHKAILMSVDPSGHAEYEKRHRENWPEVVTVLKEHGGHNYSSYFDPETSMLFGYAEIESEAR